MAGDSSTQHSKSRHRPSTHRSAAPSEPNPEQPPVQPSSDIAPLVEAARVAKRKGKEPAIGETSSKKPKGEEDHSPITDDDLEGIPGYRRFHSLNKSRRVAHGYAYDLDPFLTLALRSILFAWLPIVVNNEGTYPQLVRLFFSNMTIDVSGNIVSKVRQIPITVNPGVLEEIFKFPRTTCMEFAFGEDWDHSLPIDVDTCLAVVNENVPIAHGEMTTSKPPILSKVLLHIINNNVLPNSSNYHIEHEYSLHAAARLLQGQPIDLCEYMCWIIKEVWKQPKIEHPKRNNFALPFGNMFTTIFKHFGVNVSKEKPFLPTTVYSFREFSHSGWKFNEELQVYYNKSNDDVRKYIDGAPAPCPSPSEVPGTRAHEVLQGLIAAKDKHTHSGSFQPRQLFKEPAPPAQSTKAAQQPSQSKRASYFSAAPHDNTYDVTLAAVMAKLVRIETDNKKFRDLLAAGSSKSSSSTSLDLTTILKKMDELQKENSHLKEFIVVSLQKNKNDLLEAMDRRFGTVHEFLAMQPGFVAPPSTMKEDAAVRAPHAAKDASAGPSTAAGNGSPTSASSPADDVQDVTSSKSN